MSEVLEVKLLDAGGVLPVKANALDAGFDLSSAVDMVIPAWDHKPPVPTGLSIAVPEGYYGRIAPRSGLALKHGIDVGAGVVDTPYRGPLNVILFNNSDHDFIIKKGDRIAQLILEKYGAQIPAKIVKEFSVPTTSRGSAGFGSSGVNKPIDTKTDTKPDTKTDTKAEVVRKKMRPGGEITAIIGPMFASKSTTLISTARRYLLARKRCLIVKYAKDTRYSNDKELVTHDKLTLTASWETNQLSNIPESAWEEADVILIDEGQFFKDLVTFCEKAANLGKIVSVAGLDLTWAREPFPPMANLIPLAEKVIKLKAVCSVCGKDAAYTKRLVESTALELIGGSESYTARCRFCFDLP